MNDDKQSEVDYSGITATHAHCFKVLVHRKVRIVAFSVLFCSNKSIRI